MHSDPLKRELLIGVVAFGFGFLVLPIAIYWVGQEVIGDYVPGEGVLHLAEQIWGDLLTLQATAWILVLSPYAVVQLARLLRILWRIRNPVNRVTNPHDKP